MWLWPCTLSLNDRNLLVIEARSTPTFMRPLATSVCLRTNQDHFWIAINTISVARGFWIRMQQVGVLSSCDFPWQLMVRSSFYPRKQWLGQPLSPFVLGSGHGGQWWEKHGRSGENFSTIIDAGQPSLSLVTPFLLPKLACWISRTQSCVWPFLELDAVIWPDKLIG